MKNKRCLGFLFITLTLMVSMLSNVFASSYGYWYGSNTVEYVSNIRMKATYGSGDSCDITSSFSVKSGDRVSLSFYTELVGIETDIDGAASMCSAQLIAENGTVLANIRYELRGNSNFSYLGDDKTVTITNATAGKLTLKAYMDEPGVSGTEVRLKKLSVKVNGTEV